MKPYRVSPSSPGTANPTFAIDFLAFDLGTNPVGDPVAVYTHPDTIDKYNLDPLLLEMRLSLGTIPTDTNLVLWIDDWQFTVALNTCPAVNLNLGLRVGSHQAAWVLGGGMLDAATCVYKIPTITADGYTAADAHQYKLRFRLQWSGFDVQLLHIQSFRAN